MSRGHDPRYLAVKIPDQYAGVRCPEGCPHLSLHHGPYDHPDANPAGCWFCGCDWIPDEKI